MQNSRIDPAECRVKQNVDFATSDHNGFHLNDFLLPSLSRSLIMASTVVDEHRNFVWTSIQSGEKGFGEDCVGSDQHLLGKCKEGRLGGG